MSFDRNSNFNADANFTGVKFGENKPVLETELNELQEIQNEARAEIVRDSIPSGFVQLGELDFDYMLNNENCVKLKTDSVAYVNGYKIKIPKDTIINIGKAPEKDAREDLLFLEVWKEEVNKDTILTKNGGEGQAQITNNIKDSRYPIETSRRVALKWRIRHVANVDFQAHGNDGLERLGANYLDGHIHAQGALEKPCFESTVCAWTTEFTRQSNDLGLYTTTNYYPPNGLSDLNTLDNQSYAIPMFRLYRKPSCGKAIPFEYQKINPKVDYSKFTNLMKEERVERIVNENIQGQSLVNLIKPSFWWNPTNSQVQGGTFLRTITNETITIINNSNKKIAVQTSKLNDEYNGLLDNILPFSKGTYEIPSDIKLRDVVGVTQNGWSQDNVSDMKVLIISGRVNSKNLPIFTGLKSLGEDESLITVKNSILNESSYDPSTGTPKLNTVPGTNHITSDNLIMPTIEGQVKRGEVKVSDLTTFGKVDNLVGDEQAEFTKIKGRTLQNLTDIKGRTINNSSGGTSDGLTILPKQGSFKANTDYTLILNQTVCTLDKALKLSLKSESGNTYLGVVFKQDTGLYKQLFRHTEEMSSIRVYTDNTTTGQAIIDNIIILEGDYTNTPLDQIPYVEGIKSVGENEDNKVVVKRVGKNLFDGKIKRGYWYNGSIRPSDYAIANLSNTPIKENTTYSFYIEDYSGIIYISQLDSLLNEIKSYQTKSKESITTTKGKYLRFCTSGSESYPVPLNVNIQIEEGVFTSFEPYKEYKQEITLKEPLRSLPNGICDTIEGNKVIRRIGKLVLDGSHSHVQLVNTSNVPVFVAKLTIPTAKPVDNLNTKAFICDRFTVRHFSYITDTGWDRLVSEFISLNSTPDLIISIEKTKLSTQDLSGFKTWLSQNPTTVYYELANPVEELIEPNYDKESIKTYQLDQPLRSLPNGVKDEIVGDKLIRRCKEQIFNGSENWAMTNSDSESTVIFYLMVNNKASSSSKICCLSDKFMARPNDDWRTDTEGCWLAYNEYFNIRISKTKLSSVSVSAFKTWLQENPVKVVYELDTPIEIPLKEVLPSETNFSLARQFNYTDNYLLELPNRVKDTVENGKVTRRVGKITLNGSEDWRSQVIDWSNGLSFYLETTITNAKPTQKVLNNLFPSVYTASANVEYENIFISATPKLNINIQKSKLTSADVSGFKTWLSNNPLTILYELATPTTEELSGNNNRYCPYHKEDNTYCGSMYLGDGTNDTYTDTVIKSESIVIDTPFRESTGKLVVTDCRYKKNSDGYNTMKVVAKGKNLVNLNQVTRMNDTDVITPIKNGIKIKCTKSTTWSGVTIPLGRLKPNTTYTFSGDISSISGDNKSMALKYGNNIYVSPIGTFTTPDKNISDYYIQISNTTSISEVAEGDYTNIQVEEGSTKTSYEPFIPIEQAFENTESNDIEDLRHQVSLTGFNYEQVLNESFDLLLRGML